jgi:hypothetical protein
MAYILIVVQLGEPNKLLERLCFGWQRLPEPRSHSLAKSGDNAGIYLVRFRSLQLALSEAHDTRRIYHADGMGMFGKERRQSDPECSGRLHAKVSLRDAIYAGTWNPQAFASSYILIASNR